MLHCPNTSSCSDMTVLEKQRARINWQQHQHQGGYVSGTPSTAGFNDVFSSSLQLENSHGSMMIADYSSMGFGEPNPPPPPGPGYDDVNSVISRTHSCPPTPVSEAKHKHKDLGSKIKESFKKRKSDKPQNTKVVAENEKKDKRNKGCCEDGESKSTGQTSIKDNTATANNKNREICSDTSKEISKASEVQKPDYVHVRARRGQATDSHSLAERIRREKISERMKYLQDLVPGCNKITGKAGMLDEIINYVQSLQRQVEFLSMKLATVNPRVEFNMDDMFAKEVFPTCTPSYSTIGMSSDMTNPAYLQFNSQQQMVSSCGLDTVINPPDMGLRRTISAPVSIPETFLDSSCFTQILPSSTWEADFQNLYNVAFDQARATPFPSQQFIGLVEASNLKMEM